MGVHLYIYIYVCSYACINIYMHMYTYVYTYLCIRVHTYVDETLIRTGNGKGKLMKTRMRATKKSGQGRAGGMEHLKELNNLKFPATQYFCFLGTLGKDLRSRHIHKGISISLMNFADIHWEKGAFGRYKTKEKREHIDFSLLLTVLTSKKAPAASVTTNKKE